MKSLKTPRALWARSLAVGSSSFSRFSDADERFPRCVPDVNDLQGLGKLLSQGPFQQNDKLLGPLRGTARIKLEIQTGQRVLLLCHAEPLILAGPWDKDRLALV